MPVYFKPTSVIEFNLGIQEGGPAHKFLTHNCRLHMDRFVPYSGGDKQTYHLRENVSETADKVIYKQPYARYIYYGKKMVMENGKSAYYSPDYGFWSKKGGKKYLTNEDLVYHTPGTGPYWDRLMVSAEMSEVIKETQEYIKTHGGK